MWSAQPQVLAQSSPLTGERVVSQFRRPRKDLNPGLALLKALVPGGVEGGRGGGQQRLLNRWAKQPLWPWARVS